MKKYLCLLIFSLSVLCLSARAQVITCHKFNTYLVIDTRDYIDNNTYKSQLTIGCARYNMNCFQEENNFKCVQAKNTADIFLVEISGPKATLSKSYNGHEPTITELECNYN